VLPQPAVERYKGLLIDFWSTWSLRQMEGAGQKCRLTSPFIEAASGIEPLYRVLQTLA